ncbi:MAG: hypothetical protein M0P72_03760 [Metallibacterium scheffleri]|jgi:hypothetical protein|uniref:hypothetical protein n=1 Tax=Metallibacterium scheffleri TaxID=993689 RepID=UPI0026EBF98B|nr:hypothetical protein [Metallibacterium scheffleri]MCK9366252.1 hypothetical protein [Metallibacterium scheffleri]
MAHRILGLAALLFWLWMLLHLRSWFPGLWLAHDIGILRVARGAGLVVLMPLAGAAMLIAPEWFADRCSPYSHESGEPYLDHSFWLLLGYLTLGMAWALLQLFR